MKTLRLPECDEINALHPRECLWGQEKGGA